jgi:hypothetical protein
MSLNRAVLFRSRHLAAFAGLWGAGYLALAVHLGDGPIWWYSTIVVLAIALALLAGLKDHVAITASALTSFLIAAVLAGMTIGVLLLPAVVALATALSAAVNRTGEAPQPRAV